MTTTPALADRIGVELLRVGVPQHSGGARPISADDLAHAVDAQSCRAVRNPVLCVGALQAVAGASDGDGQPSAGWVQALRVDGDRLVGDFLRMPAWLAAEVTDGSVDRNVNAIRDLSCSEGHTHPFVVQSVGVLKDPPAGPIRSIRDVARMFDLAASSAQNGHPVSVLILASSGPVPAVTTSPKKVIMGFADRPRRPGEDVIDWAVDTFRIRASEQEKWRRAATAGENPDGLIEELEPGAHYVQGWVMASTRDPLTAGARVTLRAAQDNPHVAAAVVPQPATARDKFVQAAAATRRVAASSPGDPRAVFASNPLVAQVQQMGDDYTYAVEASNGYVPSLFAAGDYPAFCASGISPKLLHAIPWYARHAMATEPDRGKALEMYEALSAPDGHVMAAEYARHTGNREYEQRVMKWTEAGWQRRREADEEAAKVAASAAAVEAHETIGPVDEWTDDQCYEHLFGEVDRKAAERAAASEKAELEGRSVGSGYRVPPGMKVS